MSSEQAGLPQDESSGIDWIAIAVTLVALMGLAVTSPWGLNIPLAFLLLQVVVISVIIWQACDPFADAAQWVGETFRIPGSVRGATLDAVASSMPELYSGIFFVVVAVTASTSDQTSAQAASEEGFGATLATCAGSAVYNMILIPAIVALVISVYRKSRPTVDVEPEVITRDGLWFLGCEAVLIIFLFQDKMYWWMGVVLLLMYFVYILQLYFDARRYQAAMDAIHDHLGEVGDDTPTEQIVETLKEAKIPVNQMLVEKIKHSRSDEEEDEADSASVLYGAFNIPLNGLSAITILLSTTIIAAVSCYWLVEVTRATAYELDVSVFFVAVILAAAASSVPDTFLSVGAAMRGDDSGAVSNVFGSNIFDICICLSIPLLVNSYLLNWEPVLLVDSDGDTIEGLVDLRILLAVLTGITLLILWHNLQLTRAKSFVLCGLYGVFIAYAIAGSFGFSIITLLGF